MIHVRVQQQREMRVHLDAFGCLNEKLPAFYFGVFRPFPEPRETLSCVSLLVATAEADGGDLAVCLNLWRLVRPSVPRTGGGRPASMPLP